MAVAIVPGDTSEISAVLWEHSWVVWLSGKRPGTEGPPGWRRWVAPLGVFSLTSHPIPSPFRSTLGSCPEPCVTICGWRQSRWCSGNLSRIAGTGQGETRAGGYNPPLTSCSLSVLGPGAPGWPGGPTPAWCSSDLHLPPLPALQAHGC